MSSPAQAPYAPYFAGDGVHKVISCQQRQPVIWHYVCHSFDESKSVAEVGMLYLLLLFAQLPLQRCLHHGLTAR